MSKVDAKNSQEVGSKPALEEVQVGNRVRSDLVLGQPLTGFTA